ncbi:MAG TPA: hypothetical protein VJ565_05890 [Dehalococcoidia bacterium]|nr:MAG: hypothetical protein A2139_14275 [Desulfobacca sp. RBG_16_60_12]HJW88996.1 hypothetical protein [Dehalococcoidia bacterium]
MRQGTVIVQGKRVNLSTATSLYADGRFRGSRGVTLYRTGKGTLVLEEWTNWQGEDDQYSILSPEEALAWLQLQKHPDRVASAIEELEIELEEA